MLKTLDWSLEMAAKKIKDYLKTKRDEKSIMVLVDKNLYQEVDKLKADISWKELIEACLKKYIDESK